MAVLELVGGALLGAGLAAASAWRSRRDERRYQERQRGLERDSTSSESAEAVRDLDGHVEATHSKIAVVGVEEVADFAAAN